jgi:hypothetical protein
MGVHETRLLSEIDQLPASKTFFVSFCSKNGVTTSETRLAQAKAGRDYGGPAILALLGQVNRLKAFRDSCAPIPVLFTDSILIDVLVRDHESGSMEASVTRVQEPTELIRPAWVVEFMSEDRSMFAGVGADGVIGKTRVTTDAALISEERVAIAARDILIHMGHSSRITQVRLRVSLAKLATTLTALGFKQPVE